MGVAFFLSVSARWGGRRWNGEEKHTEISDKLVGKPIPTITPPHRAAPIFPISLMHRRASSYRLWVYFWKTSALPTNQESWKKEKRKRNAKWITFQFPARFLGRKGGSKLSSHLYLSSSAGEKWWRKFYCHTWFRGQHSARRHSNQPQLLSSRWSGFAWTSARIWEQTERTEIAFTTRMNS